ncbi:myosin-IIIb-like [Glandiceps talaboti]
MTKWLPEYECQLKLLGACINKKFINMKLKLMELCNELDDPSEKWERLDSIGEGTYGEVFKAEDKETGEIVAAKIMDAGSDTEEEIEAEYGIFKDHCGHPNLPKFYGAYYKRTPANQTDQLWLCMELCQGGAVTDLIKGMLRRKEKLDEDIIAYILKETIKAISHLHGCHVMHRDIKGHNVLMTSDAEIKLVDFGVSAQLRSTMMRRNTSVGTPFWMAPEVIACEQQIEYSYDIRCDIWSLGITAIELADGDPPLADQHPMRALLKIPRNKPPTMKHPEDWSADYVDFISMCLVKDFENRPTIERVLKHPFIASVPEDVTEIRGKLMDLMETHQKMDSYQQVAEVTTKKGKLNIAQPMRNRGKTSSGGKPVKKVTKIQFVDDLATLENLDEDIIVKHLFERYQRGQIYTYVGDIMIAVNPFTPLGIYDDRHSLRYHHADKGDNPPHVFGVADSTYQAMLHYNQDQCLVISGESGAGKTESANFLVTQLTKLGKAVNRNLEEKVLMVNPLLEAFGNARTVINDNSSRFGKYLELKFTQLGHVTGAELSQYLLEKSRVILQASGERSFHIFYYLLSGVVKDEKRNLYHLDNNRSYRYLHSGGDQTYKNTGSMDHNKEMFNQIHTCLETIGFTAEEIHQLYCLLSGILHIGEIDFERREMKHMSDTSRITKTNMTKLVSELIMVDEEELMDALTTDSVVTRGETIIRSNTVSQAEDVRDAMSKAIYGRLFNWIVDKLNVLMRPTKQNEREEFRTIGILDIFGFENFDLNSFEQLCINIANEQIQYYFNQHIFAWEQQEYLSEGIDADLITYEDNRPLLDMFLQKPMGMLALLDEESRFPEATDQTLVDKFYKNLSRKYYWKPLQHGLSFGIYHYAGKVYYEASNFLEKNRDTLAADIILLLRSSDMPLVRTLFERQLTRTGNLADGKPRDDFIRSQPAQVIKQRALQIPNRKIHSAIFSRGNDSGPVTQSRNKMTVASYFRYSLMELLSKMVAGTPHFVRCIKPNDYKSPGQYDHQKVMTQLKYTGVLETTRIRRQGYSHRITFADFVRRYKIIAFNMSDPYPETEETCEEILTKCKLENWLMGKTKVFLKYYHIEKLDRQLEFYHKIAIRMQARMKARVQRVKYKRMLQRRWKCAIMVQKCVRGWITRMQYREIQHRRWMAAYKIQRAVKGYLARKRYSEDLERTLFATIKIQSAFRGYLARQQCKKLHATIVKEHRQHEKKIIKAQAAVRGYLARKQYRIIKSELDNKKWDATILLQRWFRMWKKKSLYQQVLLYKSQQETWGIFFLQQINNCGQEFYNQMNNIDSPALPDLMTISERAPPSGGKEVDGVELSDERRRHLLKAGLVKVPQSPQDTEYYNSVTEDDVSRRKGRKTGELKLLTSSSDMEYYNSLSDEMPSSPSDHGHEMTNGYAELSSPGQPSPRKPITPTKEDPLYAQVDHKKKKINRPNRFSSYSSPTHSMSTDENGSLHGFGYHGENSRTSSVDKDKVTSNGQANQIEVQADINYQPDLETQTSLETGESIQPRTTSAGQGHGSMDEKLMPSMDNGEIKMDSSGRFNIHSILRKPTSSYIM